MQHEEIRIGLLTFGGGTREIRAAARRIGRQARNSHKFQLVSVNTDRTLRKIHSEFYNNHQKFLQPETRGFGYWIWKPYLIHFTLCEWRGLVDYLLYVDSGCELNFTPHSESKWKEYVSLMTREPGRLAMEQMEVEKKWQKMDVIHELQIEPNFLETGQILGGVIALRIDDTNIKLTKDWFDLCIKDGYHLVDDSPSQYKESDVFVEHRHDQSLWSILIKREGATIVPAETFWGPDWIEAGRDYPIWTPGNKTGITITKVTFFTRFRWLIRSMKISTANILEPFRTPSSQRVTK